jgi:4-amino-4-deoxy-L-arabinose transferase-like glycosyltransferase
VYRAAQVVSLVAAVLSLRTVHDLASPRFGASTALLAQLALALNFHFQETALQVGTDQLASWLALAAIVRGCALLREPTPRRALTAGALIGLSLLVRQPAVVLLPVAVVALIWRGWCTGDRRRTARPVALLLAAAALVASPQMILSWQQQGTPFFHDQGRNVWFGLHGGWDWTRMPPPGERTSVVEVIAADPVLFARHWARESAVGVSRLALMTAGCYPPSYARLAGSPGPQLCYGLTALALAVTAATWRPGRPRWRRPAPDDVFLVLAVAGWTVGVALAFTVSRFLLTPWIVTMVAVVAVVRRGPRPVWRGVAWLIAFAATSAAVIAQLLSWG